MAIKHKRGKVFVAAPPYVDKTSLGVNGSYHSYGHQVGSSKSSKVSIAHLLKLDSYVFNGVASFLGSLKKSKLLDETIVLFMGSFCHPGGHSREFIPTLIAGGGFKHQGIVNCKDKYQMSHLYVSILHQMGIDVGEFSTFKGDLDKVLT